MHFRDRRDAGQQLGRRLERRHWPDVVVLALPRGGVPVGEAVAQALGAPLEVLVVRKLGSPWNPEFGYGALAEGGGLWLDPALAREAEVSRDQIEATLERERAELVRRVRAYRGERALPDLHGKVAVVVDDGIATGSTVRAALRSVRDLEPASVVLAVPVLPPEQLPSLRQEADEVVFLQAPAHLMAVGNSYLDFAPTSDAEVVACLERSQARLRAEAETHPVDVTADDVVLPGDLSVPRGARGVVLFAHGSGSSRLSPRNRFVAQHLNRAGLATLLLDLLTEGEERSEAQTGELRFDIDLLASRLLAATHWLRAHPETAALPLGYFGASTGAGAALAAAALLGREVSAIVSRGGRPDLAGQDRLTQVTTPTLLIVGGADPEVLDLNRVALRFLPPPSRLEVVPGAGHLFEGPGELEAVADLASRWFDRCLAGPTAHPSAP